MRRGGEDIEESGGLGRVRVTGGGAGGRTEHRVDVRYGVRGRGQRLQTAGARNRHRDRQRRGGRADGQRGRGLRLGDAEQHIVDLAQLRLDVGLMTQVQGGEVQGG